MTTTTKGSLSAAGALAAVGSLVAAADVIADYPFAAGQAIRYALGAALLLALLGVRLPRLTLRELVLAVSLAATGLVLFNACIIGAVKEGDPGTVGVIVGSVPVVLAIAAPLLDGRRPSPRLVGAGAIVALGAAGVEQAGGQLSGRGALLALGALACEACFSLIAAPLLRRISPLAVSAYACLLAVPMLVVWSLAADGPSLPAPAADQAAALAYLGSVVTVGGFVLWYGAITVLGVERAGLFSGLLPISALVCSAAIGAAQITPGRLAAGVVVALGISLGMRRARPVCAPSVASPELSGGSA